MSEVTRSFAHRSVWDRTGDLTSLSWLARWARCLAAIAAVAYSPAVGAIAIETVLLPVGAPVPLTSSRIGPAPSNVVGGGTLQSVVEAAAGFWEGVFHDEGTFEIRYGWAQLENTVPAALTSFGAGTSFIRFNNTGSAFRWFLDETPLDDSEFPASQVHAQDLGGGTLNTGRVVNGAAGDVASAFDLYWIALHEIAHGLGLANLCCGGVLPLEDPRPFAGSLLPLTDDLSHLLLPHAVVGAGALRLGERRLPSDADILAIAEVNDWTDFDLPAAVALSEPPISHAMILLSFVLLHTRRRRSR